MFSLTVWSSYQRANESYANISFLIDLILTNKPENISQSGVVLLGISDHGLIFAIRQFTLPKTGKNSPMIREVKDFKNFVRNDFNNDISRLAWDTWNQFANPNTSWQVWKSLFLETFDRHAPVREKRLRQSAIPWITPKIRQHIRKRDFHKKQAIQHDSPQQWLCLCQRRIIRLDEPRRNCVRVFNTSASINADEFEDELTFARMTIDEKC